MIVAGSASPLLLSSAGGYNLTKSLRLRSSATAWLSRTISSNGSATTWTYSTWIKRGTLGTAQDGFIEARVDGLNNTEISFTSSDTLSLTSFNGGSTVYSLTTTQVFRDPSAWYHFVIQVDTTQATSSNRVRLYVNGSQVTAFSSATYPSQNATTYISQTSATHNIGRWPSPTQYFDGYMAEINFIDGQALTPSSFGQTSSTTGVWQPIKYTGTYGTNGFYLPFTNTTSTSTLGNDFSGNNNTWTVNNISLTSGVTYDSMNDVPTLTNATTANYAVMSPINTASGITVSNANLRLSNSTNGGIRSNASIGVSSGKWYFEVTDTTAGTFSIVGIGQNNLTSTDVGTDALSYGWYLEYAQKVNNGSSSAYGTALTSGDVCMVAFDLDNNKLYFGKNGTWFDSGNPATGTNPAYTITAGTYNPVARPYGSSTAVMDMNFGQRPFAYTPPTGFVALNTFNLSTPTIGATASTVANKYMDATLYTGNGSTQSITNAGGFQPDLVWYKGRSTAYNHRLFDVIRGVTKDLQSNSTDAEGTISGLTAFNSNGFSLGSEVGGNNNGTTYVAWQWKANGTGVTNTAGSITSTVSANTTAGFSIATFTSPSSGTCSFGHGLGVTPAFVIVKSRASGNWICEHTSTGTQYLLLNGTGAATTDSTVFNSAPTSSVVNLGTGFAGSVNYVSYCFAQIAGYSAFGSYTGNGSSDGPFVFTGFRPRFFMIKRTDTTTNWIMYDTARQPYNTTNPGPIYANLSSAEESNTTLTAFDILSNGFKPRNTSSWAESNASGGTYIYMAFAESPFKYANAR